MLHELLHFDVHPLSLFVRAVFVYLSVLLLLRIGGKRQLGQMDATDFVAILLISNAVQNAMNGGDNSLSGGLVLSTTLVAMSSLISVLTYRSKFFRTLFEGTPTVLVHDGKLIPKNLAKERMSESELRMLIRKQGIQDMRHVESALLEADGTLTLLKKVSSGGGNDLSID